MRIVLLSALLTASLFGQHRGTAAPARATRPSAPVYRPPVRPYYPNYPRTVAVPYPVFIGGGYGGGPGYGYGYADQGPVAVVNPNFQVDGGNQTIVDYSNIALPAPAAPDNDDADADTGTLRDDQPTVFLIALTDHTVLAAIAYWVDGDTLNWVSRDAKQNHLSVSLVDRAFSKQLNDERHVEFKLPPASE